MLQNQEALGQRFIEVKKWSNYECCDNIKSWTEIFRYLHMVGIRYILEK